jgi:branched-chain amino acid transport system ATP-binding protein
LLLEVKDLRVHYGKAEVLKGVSISVDEGAVVSIIGANGAGKTTLLRTISGLKNPTSGEIWFKGSRIDGMPSYAIARMGISHVPAGRQVFAPLTVLDNLRIGAHASSDKSQLNRDLDAIYESFPVLRQRLGQKAGSLSGGEQQMLAIARALMANPKLLIMDEPSMGLSPVVVDRVCGIIKDIHEHGLSIILVEQNAAIGLSLATKAYVLETGMVILEGDQNLANDERVIKSYLGG